MRKSSTLALIIGALIVTSPLALRADTTSPQSFNIFINAGAPGDYASSPINQFNPALGTLTGFTVTLSGSTTWTTTVDPDNVKLILTDANYSQSVTETTTGSYPININFSGSNLSGVLSYWTGTSINQFTLIAEGGAAGDTFSRATLNGTTVYDYTPVPEPSSVLLLGAGLLGLAVLCGYKKRAAQRAS